MLSGGVAAHEGVVGDLEEEFSFDEHLLERISVLEEAMRRASHSVERLVTVMQSQEEHLAMAEAGMAALCDLLDRHGVIEREEWESVWERYRGSRLVALEERDRFARRRERILALASGEEAKRFQQLLGRAERRLAALDLEGASTLFEEAAELMPENREFLFFIGESLFNRGEPGRAKDCLERLLEQEPAHAEALVYAGAISYELGEFELAKERLERAVGLTPDSFLARFSLGAVHVAEGDHEAARDHLAAALDLDRVPQALCLYGRCLHETGEVGGAIDHLEEAVERNPDFEEAHHRLGLAYLARGRHREALASLRRAQRLNPHRLRYAELVRSLDGRVSDAELPPAATDAVEAGERALAENRPLEAYGLFRRGLESAPRHPLLLTYAVLACLALGRSEELERLVQRVSASEPGELLLSVAHAAWIESLRSERRFGAGLEVGRRLLSEGEGPVSRSVALFEMAWNLAEMEEDLDTAEAYAREALGIVPEELRAFPRAALGWVLHKRGEHEQAVELLEEAAQAAPSATTYDQLGVVLLAAGAESEARRAFERARALADRRGGVESRMMECLRESARLARGVKQ